MNAIIQSTAPAFVLSANEIFLMEQFRLLDARTQVSVARFIAVSIDRDSIDAAQLPGQLRLVRGAL